jgi:hypothetical protein
MLNMIKFMFAQKPSCQLQTSLRVRLRFNCSAFGSRLSNLGPVFCDFHRPSRFFSPPFRTLAPFPVPVVVLVVPPLVCVHPRISIPQFATSLVTVGTMSQTCASLPPPFAFPFRCKKSQFRPIRGGRQREEMIDGEVIKSTS